MTKARILVTGGRSYANRARVYQILDAAVDRLNLGFLIEGGATGADTLAREWALERNVLCWTCEADWSQGKSAGPARNARMMVEGMPDIVIAFPGGSGSADMVRRARDGGVRVVEVKDDPSKTAPETQSE